MNSLIISRKLSRKIISILVVLGLAISFGTLGTPRAFATSPISAAYSATTLAEDAANDGSVTATLTITLTGDTFVGANGADLSARVSNVPTGLTAVLTQTSSTVATLSFTGNTTAHANANDVSNLTISFLNADLTGGSVAGVSGINKSDLAINFADPAPAATPTPAASTVDWAAIERAHAAAKAAEEARVAAQLKAEEEAAAIFAAAERKAAANTVKISSSSKLTKLTLNLADKYYGRIAYVQVITKTKSGVKTTTLDYFVIDNPEGTANINVKKLAKGQKLQVRIGKTIVFNKTL